MNDSIIGSGEEKEPTSTEPSETAEKAPEPRRIFFKDGEFFEIKRRYDNNKRMEIDEVTGKKKPQVGDYIPLFLKNDNNGKSRYPIESYDGEEVSDPIKEALNNEKLDLEQVWGVDDHGVIGWNIVEKK